MELITNILTMLIQVVIVIIAITFHEFSHAMAAYKLGDDTAKRMGRLTLNPIKHLDILGAIMLLIVRIGWAKPVPINPYNFDNMKIGTALTAAAGPLANFAFAILVAMIYHASLGLLGNPGSNFLYMLYFFTLQFAVMINIALGLFNLIPIPPLDGSRILGGFMTDDMYFKWCSFEKKGTYLLMIIFAVNFIFRLRLVEKLILTPLNFLTALLIG